MSKLDELRRCLNSVQLSVALADMITGTQSMVYVTVSGSIDGFVIVAVSIQAGYPFRDALYYRDRVLSESSCLEGAFALFSALAFDLMRHQLAVVNGGRNGAN